MVAANLVPSGLPRPVHGSGPGPALNMPLSPLVTSVKLELFWHKALGVM